jgi:hypothetical protein
MKPVRRKVIPRSEKSIENEILTYLKLRGVFVWPNASVGVFDQKLGIYRKKRGVHRVVGISDILGITQDGRFLAIEVKSVKGRLTADQAQYLSNINARGGLAFVARSISDVQERLGIK